MPTPINKNKEPDLSYVTATAETLVPYMRKGQLVVLGSTTYPGCTRLVLKPILEKSKLRSGLDFHLAYAPEREDPGNAKFDTAHIPKVIGGDTAEALRYFSTF